MRVDLEWTGDISFTEGVLQLVTDADAISQRLQIRLGIWQGEWFRDITFGLPYEQAFFTKAPNLAAIEMSIRATILATPGITGVTSLDLDYQEANRYLSVTGIVTWDLGIIAVSTIPDATMAQMALYNVIPVGPY